MCELGDRFEIDPMFFLRHLELQYMLGSTETPSNGMRLEAEGVLTTNNEAGIIFDPHRADIAPNTLTHSSAWMRCSLLAVQPLFCW